MHIPSILNDVIGPVMRGPSSSHSAAAVRIGQIGKELMGGELDKVTVRFDLSGSLPTTYISQGSDMGLCGGLLGFTADDARLVNYKEELQKSGLTITYINDNFGDPHPNTYNLSLRNGKEQHHMVAISLGGGMIELIAIDDVPISFYGDSHAIVIWTDSADSELLELLNDANIEHITGNNSDETICFARQETPFDGVFLEKLSSLSSVSKVRPLSPVLPILTSTKTSVPFANALELSGYADKHGITDLADLALHYESQRGNVSQEDVLAQMTDIVEILEKSIQSGLQGTDYEDRILGYQSGMYLKCEAAGTLLDLGVLNRVIPYVTALMEVKSSLGVIVAAPTAGSCGGLPGTVIAAADSMNLDRHAKVRALLAAGAIGVLVATKSTFSAEICGCQAECGVSSGMIAAAMVSMMGGNYNTSLAAASIALQNSFGMVCDPVANRVEVPCLGKNILAASNGLSAANIALAGFDHVVDFDDVVQTMDAVGRAIPHELRCTGLGGLSLTPVSQKLDQRLN
ncbi:L-serine ammonia-lyase, iron-sulfur-dependent, subunit alpha [Desulfosediminicola ganghwensis]|uniref:L-serine ammonia-lyase, iron-sulfur-dependent, subunit alpha n=1 Tax=Desulfosediminicola ganghwensis TaxID=2569540 RepID=UPI0010AC6E6F|nr:L-serine ammonia-lyase, iron-sulfur-dependent, subunit alpha [Desulfosediminicola ganghwensis]